MHFSTSPVCTIVRYCKNYRTQLQYSLRMSLRHFMDELAAETFQERTSSRDRSSSKMRKVDSQNIGNQTSSYIVIQISNRDMEPM